MVKQTLRALISLISRRQNEFDNARPSTPRPMTGLFHQLTESQKQKVLVYKGAEYTGGPKRKLA